MNAEDTIRGIVGQVLNTSADSVRLDASLKDDLGATSLDRYTILMEIEEAFSLNLDEIPEDVLENQVNTVVDILRLLKEHNKI